MKLWLQQQLYQHRFRQFMAKKPDLGFTPLPWSVLQQPPTQWEFCAIDFEATGLNPKKDRLLSAGLVTISQQAISLASCRYYLIQHRHKIPDKTVTIHHITEQEAETGMPIQTVFPEILNLLSGKILLAHFADIEAGFLQQIAKKLYGVSLPLLVMDTLQLAFYLKYKDAVHVPHNALNLFHLRDDYQLPAYSAHNALLDAVACAELFLLLSDKLAQQKQNEQRLNKAIWQAAGRVG